MTRKIKLVTSAILIIVMMAAMCALPVSAASSTGVDIYFYKPSTWSSNVKIHLWNAGSYNTSWPGVAMTDIGNGWYRYENSSISSCDVVVNDSNGKQTVDLHVDGMVTIKDNKVTPRSNKSILVRFNRPSNWGSDIKIYYYSDDGAQMEINSWPGTSMSLLVNYYGTDIYTYNISDMKNVRIMFTDGTNQYPAQNQEGIQATAGQLITCSTDGTVTRSTTFYNDLYASATTVRVNQEFTIYADMWSTGFSQWIGQVNGSDMVIVNTYSGSNGNIYTVKFTQTGYKVVSGGYADGYGGYNQLHSKGDAIRLAINVIN